LGVGTAGFFCELLYVCANVVGDCGLGGSRIPLGRRPRGWAPFVEADPARPDRVVGFDVEIAEIIAQGLNRSATFLNVAFASIDQSIERDDAEIGLGGIEDSQRAALRWRRQCRIIDFVRC
jgi:hypothetical protein